MCGFLGQFWSEGAGGAPERDEVLKRGLRRMAHRGPDDEHVVTGDDCWLGSLRR